METATLDFLARRRSVVAQAMDPSIAPSAEQWEQLFTLASRVPDHGKLAPFRFTVFEGAARAAFGEAVLAAAFSKLNPSAAETSVRLEAERFTRAGAVVALVFTPQLGRIPLREQSYAAGAAATTLLYAAQAMGFAAQWLTEWYAFDESVEAALDVPSEGHIVGFIYIGGKREAPTDRPRPEISDLIRHWEPA